MSVRLNRYSYSGIGGIYSKHSPLGSRILGINRNNDVTRLNIAAFSKQQTNMAAARSEENAFLLKKGFSWSREDTLQLMSLYEEMKELFQNVNCRELSWTIIPQTEYSFY